MTSTVIPAPLILRDEWLGDIMERPVFRVNAAAVGPDVTAAAGQIRRHAADQRAAMYYAKVPTPQIELVQALGQSGLSVIDVNVTFSLTRAEHSGVPAIPVADVTEDQVGAVLDIAASCFRYSRFHMDPRVPEQVAHRIKREWIRSYVVGTRGDALLAAVLDGRPAGFLAAISSDSGGRRSSIIDLIGVAAWAQRRGVGRALVQAFINRFRGSSDELQVGTQIANIPSIRLYEQLGFSVVASEYVLHLHVGCRA